MNTGDTLLAAEEVMTVHSQGISCSFQFADGIKICFDGGFADFSFPFPFLELTAFSWLTRVLGLDLSAWEDFGAAIWGAALPNTMIDDPKKNGTNSIQTILFLSLEFYFLLEARAGLTHNRLAKQIFLYHLNKPLSEFAGQSNKDRWMLWKFRGTCLLSSH